MFVKSEFIEPAKKKSVVIALSFVSALIMFVWGFNFLKGKSLLLSQSYYYAIFKNVGGLQQSDVVSINGMAVGQVEELKFIENGNRIAVKISVSDKSVRIPADSKIVLSSSLLGSRSINIALGNSAEDAAVGDTLKATAEPGMTSALKEQILPLKDKLESLMTELDTLITNINAVNNSNFREDLGGSVSNLNATMKNLNGITDKIQGFIDNKGGKIDKMVDDFSEVSSNLSKVSDSLSNIGYGRLVTSLETAANNLNALIDNINEGKGSAGLLMTDDSLYRNVSGTAKSLQELIDAIKQNPKKYIKVSVF